jgi:hypothetical protein
MPSGRATIVPPNTWRVIGDRMKDDEAFIPLNNSTRSEAILRSAAQAMGWDVVPKGLDVAGAVRDLAMSTPEYGAAARGGDGASIAQLGSTLAGGLGQRSATNVQVSQDQVVAAINAMSQELASRIEHARSVNFSPTVIGSRQDRSADAVAMAARNAADAGIFG